MNIYSHKKLPIDFYVYAYMREDTTYYYIGKGHGKRAWESHRRANNSEISPKDHSRIIILAHRLTEAEAHLLEKKLITIIGRKDLDTGSLINLTDGGEGASGIICSQELRQKRSDMHRGRVSGPITNNHRIALSNANTGKKQSHEQIAKRTDATRLTREKTGWSTNQPERQQRVICPHCGKEGGISGMYRYHFDSCKTKT